MTSEKIRSPTTFVMLTMLTVPASYCELAFNCLSVDTIKMVHVQSHSCVHRYFMLCTNTMDHRISAYQHMYVFSYCVQQLSLTSKGLRQFTLAPLVISCLASFTSPPRQARYNDIFCDYKIKPNNHRTEISGYCTRITISSIQQTNT